MRLRKVSALLATVVAIGLLGTASSAGAPAPAKAGLTLAPAADQSCDVTRSLPPSRDDSGPKIQQIKQRGTLVVGVDQNSYHWGYRNPATGQIEGFDIDLARAVAKAILNDPDKVTFKTVPTARRIEAVQNGEVDLIARTMTITCDRLKQVAFSAPYFRITQSVVVPKAAKAGTFDQALRGRRACVADQSSSQALLKSDPHGSTQVTAVANQLDCLVLMQLGQTDATLTDTELAAAQAAQDPTVTYLPAPGSSDWMGVAMNQKDTDLVARVNQVLTDYLASGGWQESYAHWLAPTMGSPAAYRP